ncbi:hypothetical protein NBRC116583_19710 [Arenicella sp. 4NH20-0111]|uniref:hypothetical protein n=1 Tax=Arenicella sp. 4NH20-0111 TaxID=3127648 RepID=UPI00310625BF
MSQVNLKTDLLLNAILTHLNQRFFTDSRDAAKTLFNHIAQGERIPFMKFDLGESGEMVCELELETSEYIGRLNFGKFRRGLALMLQGIHQRLEAKESLNPLSSETGELLFNIPGILKTDDGVNIMVCGFRPLAAGLYSVRLMYLEPKAYTEAAGLDMTSMETNDDGPDNLD